jgi:hypothetical protein
MARANGEVDVRKVVATTVRDDVKVWREIVKQRTPTQTVPHSTMQQNDCVVGFALLQVV